MKYFLGIDVGSSKTDALVVTETGHCIGYGKAGGGNHQSVGYDGLQNVLQQSAKQALAMAGIVPNQITAAGFGVAGYDFPSDREGHLEAISSLNLACPVEIVNDGINGLLAGASRGIGVNVTAGSSNNCRGRNSAGVEGRIVGNGVFFGEYGGGLEITLKAFQMVNYAWIKRIPPTALTKIMLEATGAKDEIDLMEGVSNEQYQLLPAIAINVIQAAQAGDLASREVIHWAGEELGWLAVSVARQISMQDEELEIIQSGSVFEAGGIIAGPMQSLIQHHLPQAKIIRLDGPPVVGAVILGMEQVNFDGYAVRRKIVTSAKEIRRV